MCEPLFCPAQRIVGRQVHGSDCLHTKSETVAVLAGTAYKLPSNETTHAHIRHRRVRIPPPDRLLWWLRCRMLYPLDKEACDCLETVTAVPHQLQTQRPDWTALQLHIERRVLNKPRQRCISMSVPSSRSEGTPRRGRSACEGQFHSNPRACKCDNQRLYICLLSTKVCHNQSTKTSGCCCFLRCFKACFKLLHHCSACLQQAMCGWLNHRLSSVRPSQQTACSCTLLALCTIKTELKTEAGARCTLPSALGTKAYKRRGCTPVRVQGFGWIRPWEM